MTLTWGLDFVLAIASFRPFPLVSLLTKHGFVALSRRRLPLCWRNIGLTTLIWQRSGQKGFLPRCIPCNLVSRLKICTTYSAMHGGDFPKESRSQQERQRLPAW